MCVHPPSAAHPPAPKTPGAWVALPGPLPRQLAGQTPGGEQTHSPGIYCQRRSCIETKLLISVQSKRLVEIHLVSQVSSLLWYRAQSLEIPGSFWVLSCPPPLSPGLRAHLRLQHMGPPSPAAPKRAHFPDDSPQGAESSSGWGCNWSSGASHILSSFSAQCHPSPHKEEVQSRVTDVSWIHTVFWGARLCQWRAGRKHSGVCSSFKIFGSHQ